MALKRRLSDVSYRLYDRSRHGSAFEAAARPGTAPDFSVLKGHKYALLVTFRGNGSAVPTPVWFALLDDRRFVAHTEERTAKVRRIRRDPRARVFPCDPRGKPPGPGVEGTARMLPGRGLGERGGGTRPPLRAHPAGLREADGRVERHVYIEVVPATG